MEKKKFSHVTYVKVVLFVVLYFYLFISSAYQSLTKLQNDEDAMSPLIILVFCLAIAAYVILGKRGKTNPLDKKISPYIIALVLILFFTFVGLLYWYTRDLRS